jgi:UDP-N-acetylglucosamine acyltransferase
LPKIHPLAYVDPSAELADDVIVGPFCYIEGGTKIGAGCILESHVTVKRWTTIGAKNYIAQGAVLGGDPQDNKYHGEETYLVVGNNNIIREYVTLHRATGEGKTTTVGDDCFIMAYCHVGHNCTVHNMVTMANSVGVAGYVTIEERATIGGMCGIHQFCRIGKIAMVGGFTKVTKDVPPFMLVDGAEQEVKDINAVGLRRIGITADDRLALHKACKLLYKSQLGTKNAMEIIVNEVPSTKEVEYLLEFERRRSEGRNGRGDQR